MANAYSAKDTMDPTVQPPKESSPLLSPRSPDKSSASRSSTAFSLYWEIFVQYIPLSLFSFGGPQVHIAMLSDRFVRQEKWLSQAMFLELLGLGSCIPGPTSTEVATAVGAVRGGVLGGIVAFLSFSLPTAILMLLIGLGMKAAERETEKGGEAPSWLAEAGVGLQPAAISLILTAAYRLGGDACGTDSLKLSIAFVATFLTVWMPASASSWGYPLLFLLGGLTTLMDQKMNPERERMKREAQTEREAAMASSSSGSVTGISKATGFFLFSLWLGLLLLLISLRTVFHVSSPLFLVFETFFRVGSLVFGGGQVVLPLLSHSLVSSGWLSSSVFFTGLAIVQTLPGPMFNLAAYLGAAYLGLWGGVLAWLGVFAPGILLMLSLLPFWEALRTREEVKGVLRGVTATSVGFITASFVFMQLRVVHTLGQAAIMVFCIALVGLFRVNTPVSIILSGLLGWMMMILDLGGPYCMVPSYVEHHPQWAEYCHTWNQLYGTAN